MTHHEWLQHTADIKLAITASTLPALFAEGVTAVAMFLYEHPDHDESGYVEQQVALRSTTPAFLLVDFFSDLIAYATIHQACFTHADIALAEDACSLVATLKGYRVSHFDRDLKAATYHEAALLLGADNLLHATVVFDI